jgi:hypothetical protein
MKNPQTTIAPTFLTHNISAIDGVEAKAKICQRKGSLFGRFKDTKKSF